MKKIIFYGFQYPHHGKHSAFFALAHKMKNYCKIIKFKHPSSFSRYYGKLGLSKLNDFLHLHWFNLQELRLKRYYKSKETLIHYFFPEDSLRAGPYWAGPAKIAITLHQPLSYMETLRASRNNAAFFEGLSRADLIFLMSGSEIETYRKLFPRARVEFVPHGVDVDFFHPVPKLRTAGAPLRIVTVGTWLRDYELWANIAERLSELELNIELTVISNKHLIAKTREKLPVNVVVNWYSGISDEQLAKSYQQADLLLLPLIDAWANNALLEAMASGLPVLCSDLPATREYLGEDGLFANTTEEFVSQIRKFIENLSHRDLLSQRLRAKACIEYSWASVAERHMSIYNATLGIKVA
jgi:glycosyltransferase involved in cell wall biosynthesis